MTDSKPTYKLRRTRKAFMIDKLTPEPGFEPPLLALRRSFGPFPSKDHATRYMIRHLSKAS
jgi:hypothetical protein